MKCKCPESGEIYNIYNVPILFTQELLPLGLTENDLVDRKKNNDADEWCGMKDNISS